MSQHIDQVHELLSKTGLQGKPDNIIYSGYDTLSPGKYYFLGQNPGRHIDEKKILKKTYLLNLSPIFSNFLRPLPELKSIILLSYCFHLLLLAFLLFYRLTLHMVWYPLDLIFVVMGRDLNILLCRYNNHHALQNLYF